MHSITIDNQIDPQVSPIVSENRRVRLLSYNIQVGIAATSIRQYITTSWKHLLPHAQIYDNLAKIAGAINEFDIVALQEVDAGSFRSSFVNQIEFLARQGGFPYWYHQTNREIGILTKHSNGILSKFQPIEVDEYKLPGPIPGRGVMVVRYGSYENPLILMVGKV